MLFMRLFLHNPLYPFHGLELKDIGPKGMSFIIDFTKCGIIIFFIYGF